MKEHENSLIAGYAHAVPMLVIGLVHNMYQGLLTQSD